jgi:hypothetical protein
MIWRSERYRLGINAIRDVGIGTAGGENNLDPRYRLTQEKEYYCKRHHVGWRRKWQLDRCMVLIVGVIYHVEDHNRNEGEKVHQRICVAVLVYSVVAVEMSSLSQAI